MPGEEYVIFNAVTGDEIEAGLDTRDDAESRLSDLVHDNGWMAHDLEIGSVE